LPLPQPKHEVYSQAVTSPHTHPFELQKIIRDIKVDLKHSPETSHLLMLLGMALFRVGQEREGINKMRYSLKLNYNRDNVGNLALSLERHGAYDEAWNLLKQHDMGSSLFDAVLCGRCDTLDARLTEDVYTPLTELARLIFNNTPYGSIYNLSIEDDIDDGKAIINITSKIPAPVESVFSMYCDLTKDMAKKFSGDVLMQVIPKFVSII